MQCQEIEELLSEYIDGVLDQQKHSRVTEHLRQCTACSRSLSDLQDTVRLLRSLGEVTPPANFRQELRVKLEKEILRDASSNKSKLHLRSLVSGYRKYAAIAAAVVGLGVGLYSFNQPEMDKYLGSSNKAAQQETFSAADASVEKSMGTTSVDSPRSGAASVAEAPAANTEIANDPALSPPGMGEGVPPVKSMQSESTSESQVNTAPEPEKAIGLLAADMRAAADQPAAGDSGASVKGIQEKKEITTTAKVPGGAGESADDAAKDEGQNGGRVFALLVVPAVLAAGAVIGALIYYLRRRV